MNILNEQSYNEKNDYISELISELFYEKSNPEFKDEKKLLFLLMLLKNKNIKFDNNYLNLILKIKQLLNSITYDTERFKFKVNSNNEVFIDELCELFTFLAIDYNRIIELNEKSDLVLLNILFSNVLEELSYLVVCNNYDNILNEIKKYNDIIYNILVINKAYMQNYVFRKAKFYKKFYKKYKYIDSVDDSMLNFENSIFLVTVEIFISNIRTLKYDYKLISEVMKHMNDYLIQNYNQIVDGSINFQDVQEYILNLLKNLCENKIYVIKH